MFEKGLYWLVKDKIWKSFGVMFYDKRNDFLLDLLAELQEAVRLARNNDGEFYVLDVGCGTGDISEKISKMFHLSTVGVDLDKRFISSNNVNFLNADSCKLPFRLRTFRMVTAFSLIEHIEKNYRQVFYDEVKKLLLDDATFVIQLPNRYFPVEQHSFLPFVGYLPSRLHRLFYFSYVSVPSKKETLDELTRHGFEIVRIMNYGIPFSGFPGRHLLSKFVPFGFIIIAKKRM